MINKTDPETMKQVIIFMYTAKCELSDSNGKVLNLQKNAKNKFSFLAFSLLDAAGRYDIKDLKVHTGRCE